MSYAKQNFTDGQILTAENLNHIEDGIAEMEQTTGANGGYYTPSVTQPDESTVKFAFTPSKEGMAEVPEQSVTLPSGAGGEGSFSDSAKIALLNCFEKVAWVDENGRALCDALKEALNVGSSLNEYVTDGIELWFDGIRNTRIGHSSLLNAWEDLSGYGHDMRCVGNVTGTSVKAAQCGYDYVYFDGSTAFFNEDKITSLLTLAPGTLEVVFEQENGDDAQVIFSAKTENDTRNKGIWYRPSSNGYRIFTTEKGIATGFAMDVATEKTQLSVTYTDNSTFSAYVNGSKISNFFDGGTMPCWKTFSVGAKAFVEGEFYAFQGKIYAIRYYNRVLAPEEIAQNLAADKNRFGF